MITIEPTSLRRGGWKHSEGIVSDLRHIDTKLGTLLFFGAITAVLFYLFYRTQRSMMGATIYTSSSVCMLAISFSTIFGIDLFGSLGASLMPL